jgi:hypothetical protein
VYQYGLRLTGLASKGTLVCVGLGGFLAAAASRFVFLNRFLQKPDEEVSMTTKSQSGFAVSMLDVFSGIGPASPEKPC